MIKQTLIALVLPACLLVSSCKDETCARCELKEVCVICDSNGTMVESCGDENEADAFTASCVISGGSATRSTGSPSDTRELCNEESLIVNEFMDEKSADGYECKYID